MQRSCSRGVDFVSTDEVKPFCPHGPTLLFERYYKDQPPRKYFACSVYRDRKQCSFFAWADAVVSDDRRKRWKQLFENNKPKMSREELMVKLATCKKLKNKDLQYCTLCCALVLPNELVFHAMHKTMSSISSYDLLHPSKFLTAITSKKGEAQYFFTDECTQFLLSSLEDKGFTTVLCVGTPRLHEAITSQRTSIRSFLLDIDYRYAQFFSPENYQQFNLFTSFFYDTSSGQKYCEQFLCAEKEHDRIVLIVDPPFGGLTDAISNGMQQLWKMIGKEVSTFLIFPYFLESHVIKSLPNFYMLDYEVSYDNHQYFKRPKKRPSFVRIFTNIPLPGLKLPLTQGYSLCQVCDRFVSKNNVHCQICDVCPSKDGKPYMHCHWCQRCVKGGYVHCESCSTCLPMNHICLPMNHICHSITVRGCHICGSSTHKRRDCPRKDVSIKGHQTVIFKQRKRMKRRWHRRTSLIKQRRLLYCLNKGIY